MRKGIFLVIIVLFLSIQNNIFAQKKKVTHKDPLIGNWRTVPNPLAASYLRLEFHPDHTFFYKLNSEWQGRYRLSGTTLTSTYFIKILNKTKTESSTVLINSDTLLQVIHERGKDSTITFIRKGGAKKGEGIIGTWIVQNSIVPYMAITYNTNGSFEVNKILREFTGNFTDNGKTFSLYSGKELLTKMTYIFERGLLLIYSKEHGHLKMERVKD